MEEICGALEAYNPRLDPRPSEFRSSRTVDRIHARAYRGGRTRNITAVIAGEDSSDEYIRGLVTSAIVIGIVFIVWLLLLCIFKCPGVKHRVGFLAGRAIPLPHDNDDEYENEKDDNEQDDKLHKNTHDQDQDADHNHHDNSNSHLHHPHEESNHQDEGDATPASTVKQMQEAQAQRWTRILRCMALLGGLGIVIGCSFMLRRGIHGLYETIDAVQGGLGEGQRLTTDAATMMQEYVDRQKPIVTQLPDLLQAFNGFCPNVRQQICQVDAASNKLTQTCDFSNIPLADALQDINLPNLENATLFRELEKLIKDLNKAGDDLQEVSQDVEEVEFLFTIAKAFVWIVMLLNLLLMVCLVHAWRTDVLHQQSGNAQPQPSPRRKFWMAVLQNWILLPLFIIFIFLSIIFSTLFYVAAVTTADVCFQGPDDKILVVLENSQDEFDTVIYNFATYYVDSCPPEKAPTDFDQHIGTIAAVFDAIANFLDSVRDSRDDIAQRCGNDPVALVGLAELLLDQLCLIRDTLVNIRLFMSCANWHPLYAAVAHRAVCSDATYSFHWLAVSQMVIVAFALILLTSRAALSARPPPAEDVKKRNFVWEWINTHLLWHSTGTSMEAPAEQEPHDQQVTSPHSSLPEKFRDESASQSHNERVEVVNNLPLSS